MSERFLRPPGARALVLACACALVFTGRVRADGAATSTSTAPQTATPTSTPTATATPPATTSDDRPASGEPVELPEVVIRVPRAEARSDPAAAATTVSADRFAGEAKGVAELLATVPGVAVTRYGSVGQRVTVQVRGISPEGVKVLLDGIPLGGAGGGVDLASIPRSWIDRIEVVRGLAGARHGAGALGGAVDVLTRAPRAGEVSGEASTGSFGTRAISAEGAARAGPFAVLAAVGGETTRGDFEYLFDDRPSLPGNPLETRTREHNGSTRAGALAKIGGLAGAVRLDALLALSGGERDLPGSPYQPTPGDWQEDARLLGSVRVAGFPGGGLAAALRLHGRADRLDVRLASLGPEPTRQRGGAGGLEAEASILRGRMELGGSASAELEGYESDALGGTRTRTSSAGAIAADVALAGGRARLTPAVRIERVGGSSGVPASLGAVLALARQVSLRASAGRTFRAPTFAELYLEQGLVSPNPDLAPETGTGGDAALVYDGPLGLASLGAHATLLEDAITYEPASLGRYRPFNTREARIAGLEAELATAPVRRLLGLALSAAYTYLPTRILSGPPDVVGNRLPGRPLHRLHARAAAGTTRAGAHVEADVLREQFRDARNVARVPDMTVVGAGAFLKLAGSPVLSLHVQVENLADVRDLTDGFGQPLPGRTLMVSVRAAAAPYASPPKETP